LHAYSECEATTVRRYNLPPLDLLEAFEASARHLSFTRAADELSLTQSAISRQVKALEDRLGVVLFQRLHRALRLTEQGEQLLRVADDVLRQLHGVTERLRLSPAQKTVVLTTTPGFAGLWLIPRLAGFTARRPDVDVRISASYALVNLERDGVDLAIRYCTEASVGADSPKLFGEVVLPVCSPSLRKQASRPLKRPEDLRHHVLLYGETNATGQLSEWPMWLRAMKLDELKPAGALHFSQYDQMINACVSGQGVALGRLPLIAGLLKEGRLVAPLGKTVASAHGYHLVRSPASSAKPEVEEFAAWLLQEARQPSALSANPKSRGADSSIRADRARP
jgi:LysR family glycine cleavage system transcriptional activator